MRGTVVSFDEPRGLGEVESEDGRRYPFHCTVVTDGSRRVDVGAAVEFEVAPGLPGRWEAVSVTPGSAPPPARRPDGGS